jgi:hypothetical protein
VIDSVVYTIPVGNYNANTMITQLLTLLPSGFSMTYSTINNKYSMTYTSNFTINASHPLCKINSVLGLGDTDITSQSNSLTFPYVVNFLPIPRINFRSNFFNFGNYNQADNTGDIFLSLQNNAPQQACINYYNQSMIKFLVLEKGISSFVINVCNDAGQLINFNNVDWYLTFQIDIEYLEAPMFSNFSDILQGNQRFPL